MKYQTGQFIIISRSAEMCIGNIALIYCVKESFYECWNCTEGGIISVPQHHIDRSISTSEIKYNPFSKRHYI